MKKNFNAELTHVLFLKNGVQYVTTIDVRSKVKFKKLINKWGKNSQIIHEPITTKEFMFIQLQQVLQEIEDTYKEMISTPSTQKIKLEVFCLLDSVCKLNNECMIDVDLDAM